jgi:hypothetical protein
MVVFLKVCAIKFKTEKNNLQIFGTWWQNTNHSLKALFDLLYHCESDFGVSGWILAIAAGIIATGPVYVWYSMLAEFWEKRHENCFCRRIPLYGVSKSSIYFHGNLLFWRALHRGAHGIPDAIFYRSMVHL